MSAGLATGAAATPMTAPTAALGGDIGLAHRPVLQGLVDRADPVPVSWSASNALVRQLGGHAGHWRGTGASGTGSSAAGLPAATPPAAKEPAR